MTDHTGEDDTIMKKRTEKPEREDPRPLTDEEFAEFQRKEKRKGGIISAIIDFFLGFFQ